MEPSVKSLVEGGIKGIGDTFANIVGKFKADPTKVAEIEQELEKARIEANLKAIEIANQAEEIQAKELESVNQTMREEDKSEHFLVFSWRPLIGYCFIAVVVNNYIILPYFTSIKSISIPDNVWSAILVILGVASAGRSASAWQKEKNKA